MTNNTDFTFVKRRKCKTINQYDENSPEYYQRAESKISGARSSLTNSPQYHCFTESVDKCLMLLSKEKPATIICYGLGNFTSSPTALYQYALLLELSLYYNSKISVFDPVFTETEKKLLEAAGCSLILTDERGKKKVDKTTIFYLPHCPLFLFNNLLESNWGPGLSNCIVVGNNLSKIAEKSNIDHEKCYFVQEIIPKTTVIEIKDTYYFIKAFNDTAVHIFNT